MSWTDDRVALLKNLWTEGKTAAEIAKALGGVTRNAVIGKAHRLKLSNRVSPIQQNKKPAQPKKKAEPVVSAKKILAEDAQRDTVPLVDIGARDCRWPIGDPQDENFGFCGCPALPGLPYCMEHAQVAYQAATRNRIMKSAEVKDVTQARETLEAQANDLLKKAANR